MYNEYIKSEKKIRLNIPFKINLIKSSLKKNKFKLNIGHYISQPIQYFHYFGKIFSHDEKINYTVILDKPSYDDINLFNRLNIKFIKLSEVKEYFKSYPDILFIQHPYYNFNDIKINFYGIMHNIPEELFSENIFETPLLCYIPYGYGALNDNKHKPVNGAYNLPIHNIAWKVFCESVWHKNQAKVKSITQGLNYIVSGYPKLDDFFQQKKKIINKNKFNIIWAPHHNEYFENIPIKVIHKTLVKLINVNQNVNIIFRPHPNLLRNDIDNSKHLLKNDFNKIFNFWKFHRQGRVNMSSEIYYLFFQSDMMITNCVGFQIEYFITKKPLLSYIKLDYLNDLVRKNIIAHCFHANNVFQINKICEELIKKSNKSNKSNKIIKLENSIFKNITQKDASKQIIENIKKEFFC